MSGGRSMPKDGIVGVDDSWFEMTGFTAKEKARDRVFLVVL